MKGSRIRGPKIVKKKAIDTEKDPYLPEESPGDVGECKKCGCIYTGKHWALKSNAPEDLLLKEPKVKLVCPACRKIAEKFAEGYVTIQGDFLKVHKDEILNLIRNKEKIAMDSNPLERIIEIKDRAGTIEVTTTTEKLAQRIGQMLHKAFHGEVEYKWSDDVKLARVVWSRQG